MAYPEWIEGHNVRLETHRKTLMAYLQQQAAMDVYTPPYVITGIDEARRQINQIKHELRAAGLIIADLPIDAQQQTAASSTNYPQQSVQAPIFITGSTINGDVVSGNTTKTVNNYYSHNQSSNQNQQLGPFLPLHQAIRVNIPVQRQQEAAAQASQMQAAVNVLDLAQLELTLQWFRSNHPGLHYIIRAIFEHPDIRYTIASAGNTKDVHQLLKSIFADKEHAE